MLLQRQPTPFTVSSQKGKLGRLKTGGEKKKRRKKTHIKFTFCSAARIAGPRVQFALLEGVPIVKDLIHKSAALRDEFQCAPHLAHFGFQCCCPCSLKAATIIFCKGNSGWSLQQRHQTHSHCPCTDDRHSWGAVISRLGTWHSGTPPGHRPGRVA